MDHALSPSPAYQRVRGYRTTTSAAPFSYKERADPSDSEEGVFRLSDDREASSFGATRQVVYQAVVSIGGY